MKRVLNNKECPCRYCTVETGRHSGCHGECSKYKEWDTEKKEWKTFLYKERQKEKVFRNMEFEKVERLKKERIIK